MQNEKFQNLLRLMKLTGGKYIIVEDGQPRAVLMSYEEFSDLAVPRAAEKLAGQISKIEEINRRITNAQLEGEGGNSENDLLMEEIISDPSRDAPSDGITFEPIEAMEDFDTFQKE